jgi:hypothetical protein
MTRSGLVLVVSLLIAGFTATGCDRSNGDASASAVTAPHTTFSHAAFISCLNRLSLPRGTIPHGQFTKPLNEFPSLTSETTIIAAPSGVDPKAKGTIDTVQLFFFKRPQDARKAQATLAQYYVYFKAPFTYLHELRPIPPNKAALHKVERVDGNVDIFWNYPRQHAKASDATLARCLR